MNVRTILNNFVALVCCKMHKTRQKSLLACVRSLLDGHSASVTHIGRGIRSKAFEKHRIKRADRLLSNPNLQRELPLLYLVLCRQFCTSKHPVIAVDWSDLDEYKGHFLLRAALTLKGRPITLYQEVHSNKTKEKPATHKRFLHQLHTLLPDGCQPIIVTDAGFKSPWFREVQALGWHSVGRVRKPHFYSVDNGQSWRCISHLYQQASTKITCFGQAKIARSNPFDCSLVLVKHKPKGRHAYNANGSVKRSTHSLKHAAGADDPWLLATTLPMHRQLAKQVVAIYQQRMQIEEGFRDTKSTRFGLGFEQHGSTKQGRLSILLLLTTLASIVAMLIGMTIQLANKHRRFQANTQRNPALSFHTLGLRAWATQLSVTKQDWHNMLQWLKAMLDAACYAVI